jgi:hypothetical protein
MAKANARKGTNDNELFHPAYSGTRHTDAEHGVKPTLFIHKRCGRLAWQMPTG